MSNMRRVSRPGGQQATGPNTAACTSAVISTHPQSHAVTRKHAQTHMSTTRVSSLRLTARNILLGTIEAIPAERKIVLLDRTTVRIVDAVCTLNDILDVGVYLVETVEKRRQPYPTMDAVYFITPERGEDASVTVVSRDFADKLPMYKSVHLFFTNEVSQGLFQMLATSPAGPFVKSFQEMFVDFIPVEARAFHLGMDGSFGRLLRGGADTIPGNMGELEGMANRLVSLIVSLNELPTIRYRATGGAAPDCEGRLSARLANLVQEALDRYVTRNPGFRPVAGGELLIMDRTMDLAAPLLHEFTYQAMAQDLLSIHHENRYDYKFSSGARGELATRTVALDENDSLWVAMRHTHIADCSKLIISRFNQFTSENKAAIKHTAATKQSAEATADANVTSLSELKQTMNALGEFQELKAQYSLHLTIAQDCLTILEKKKLAEVAGVEQNMVMGVDADGRAVKDIWRQMAPLLDRENLTSRDKARLIMLFLLSQSGTLSDADRRSMLDHAKLENADLEALRRLMMLCGDAPVMAPQPKKKPEAYAYEASRYVPRIKAVMQDAVGGVLDQSAFATVKGSGRGVAVSGGDSTVTGPRAAPVSLRHKAAAPAAGSVATAIASSAVPSRSVIAFVIGGMTYSEIRAAYEVAEATKREVYIGSTHLLTPDSFIENLRTLQ